jgi:hypothetical protein
MTDRDDFYEDDIDDVKTVEYIRNTLPQELKEKYTDDILYYIIDVINDFFTSSGVLDQEPGNVCLLFRESVS